MGEQFAGGGSPEVQGAWSHAGHQVPMMCGPQLEQVLIPRSGLQVEPHLRMFFYIM